MRRSRPRHAIIGFRRSPRRRLALLVATALVVPLAVASLPAAPASAVLSGSGSTFHAEDGDLILKSPQTGTDWVNAPAFHRADDSSSGKNDTSFKGGVNEDTVNPATGVGAIPNSKDDLLRFYLGYEETTASAAPTKREMLYLAWIRAKTSGSADFDFELNQSAAKGSNGLPVRTDGDVLVTYEFISTKTPTISLLRWRTAASAACYSASAAPCWADRVPLNSSNSEGSVNDGFSVVDPRNSNRTLASQTFGEAAIDLTQVGVFSSSTCTRFAQAFAKSRSSHSFSASLQDLIAPVAIDLSNCLTKTFSVTMATPPPAGLTPYAVFSVDGGPTRSVALAQSGTTSTWTGSDGTIPPGATLTGLHLELRTADGTLAWRSTDSAPETISSSRTNNGTLSYAVALSPASATNFAGKPHPLTATVKATGGLNGVSSTAPVAAVPVRFATFGGSPSGCGTLTPTSDATDANGEATTVLTSSSACSTSIRAWVDGTGGTSGSFDSKDQSGTATKVFESFALDVTPAEATNALGTNHTFTVTLTRSTGAGTAGYAGQTVDVSLGNAAATGAHLVSVNGAPASGTSASCTTSAQGTCSVVATATSTGTFTLDASYTTANDSGQGTFQDSGKKSYVDYRVSVSPNSATNEVGDAHTVTVLLEQEAGSGWQPLAGKTVTLALDKGTTDAHLTSVNGAPATGTTGSCTTTAQGTCSVTYVATTPGTAVLTATYGATLDSGPLTRSDTANKLWSAFDLSVSPLTAVNQLGDPHTFVLTLTRDDGSGPYGYAGQVVGLALDPGTTDATLASPTCTTSAAGTCEVTIVSTRAGTAVLTATYSATLDGTSTVSLSSSATKQYLDLQVAKSACATSAPLGGLLRFDIPWSVDGATLTNATITDNLPAGLTYVSATPAPTAAPAVGSTGTVVWELASPLASGSSGVVSLVVRLAEPGQWTNTGAFTADGGISKPFSSTVTAAQDGAAASGKASGLAITAGGVELVPPTPETTDGVDELLSVGVPPELVAVLGGRVGVLDVSNHPSVSATSAQDEATATVADVDLLVSGVSVKAKAVQAKSTSTATGSTATTDTLGSQVVGLAIGGGTPQTYSNPTVLPVVNVLGVKVAEISVLEPVDRSGAALGGAAGAQPQNGLFQSGQGINGLHIRLLGSNVEVVVAHAESKAAFPSAAPCPGTGPYVVGSAYVADLDTWATDPSGQELDSHVTVVPVLLPSTGGTVTGAAALVDLSAVGATSGTGTASSSGTLPSTATSTAEVKNLVLGPLSASLIRSTASSPGLTGGAELAKLVIDGTNVCQALGITGFCAPPPNHKWVNPGGNLLVLLNEQVKSGNQITVNAVHIYVIGKDNPFGLPVGADLVISSATAGFGS